ncbi:hypothetical protein [Nonomuraea sp. NPDC046570]|uniref:hypothetical protein n=1 Tax=Nonomuraea sp. NPDC046570 TaxID=3155255 RepID=UPI0033C3EEED
MSKWVCTAAVACAVLAAGCGEGAEVVMRADQVGVAAAVSVAWTREKVVGLFLDPAGAGLRGGEVHVEPQGTTAAIDVCVPLNPFDTPRVAVDRRFATLKREIGLPGKGRIVQRGWVLPSADRAGKVMRKVGKRLSACRYDGTAATSLEPGKRMKGSSSVVGYPRDDDGWRGYRIEQTTAVDRQRVSVGTEMLVQRGPVVLRLDYVNYEPHTGEQTLRAYNIGVLRKVLARPA